MTEQPIFTTVDQLASCQTILQILESVMNPTVFQFAVPDGHCVWILPSVKTRLSSESA